MKLIERLGISNAQTAGTFKRESSGIIGYVASFAAIAMSLYHIYVALFGIPEWMIHRPLHVAFFLFIGFLTFRGGKKRDTAFGMTIDILFALAAIGVYLYILANFERFSLYMFMVTKLTPLDYVVICITFFLVIEMTRRTTGWSIIIVAAVFVVYTLFARYMPAAIRGASVSLKNYLAYMFLVSDGLFGSTVNISSTYVFLFILFGTFLEESGVGEFFIDFATKCTENLRGGAAKASILASGLFGSISGSAVANVYATGTFTIPLMKKIGFKNEVAGATEAVASSGGAIMPPVMGSTAFLMADFLGVSYGVICKAALIPAVLYYLSLWFMMDMEAFKVGMAKKEKGDKTPIDFGSYLRRFYMIAPIAAIIIVILMGKSVTRAAFIAIVVTIIVGLIHDARRMNIKNLLRILDKSGRSAVTIAAPLTCAAIVVGTINLTGVGLKFTSIIMQIAGNSLEMALLLTMIITIILGMGLPTPAAYMLVAVFAPGTLTNFGVPALTAHMFCFYYAAFSTITPPVAMAAYAGGNLAGAPAAKTGFVSCRLGIAAYIIPWIFVYSNSLLLEGNVLVIIQSVATALIGVYMLASGVQGVFANTRINPVLRAVALACAICMIISGTVTDIIGVAILVLMILYVKKVAKRK